jgi:hypothetical protein
VRATELELDDASIELLNKASAYEESEKRIA